MQAVLDGRGVLARLLELVGGIDLDGESERLLRRPVEAVGLAAPRTGARLLHLQRARDFVGIVLKDNDGREQIRQTIGTSPPFRTRGLRGNSDPIFLLFG